MKKEKIIAEAKISNFFQRKNTVFVELAGGLKDKLECINYGFLRRITNGEYVTDKSLYFTQNKTIDIVRALPNMDVNQCWKDMSIVLKLPNDGFPRINLLQIHAVIKFNCEHKGFKETDAYYCLKNMRNGKCPYQFARMLFPDAYKNKEAKER